MQNFLAKFFLTALLLIYSSANALSPEPRIPDDAKEQRAMKLFLEVRCLVCEGQVIESSNTEFSLEMRKLIRRKILEGKSDEEIKSKKKGYLAGNLDFAKNSLNVIIYWSLLEEL